MRKVDLLGNFEGTLRGEKVVIKDVTTQKIVNNKRAPAEVYTIFKESEWIGFQWLSYLWS